MMRFFFSLLFLTSIIFASSDVSFGEKSSEAKKRVYSVRLFLVNKQYSKKEILAKIPLALRDDIYFRKDEGGMIVCYSKVLKYQDVAQKLKKAKEVGYKKARIVLIRKLDIPEEENRQEKFHKLSKFTISKMIAQANKAYRSGDEMQAMMIYEMLLSAGVKSQRMKNNVCYLYGKYGAWSQAKDMIQKERYQSKLLYAYASGAVITSQKNFYDNLKEYILLDRSGHLALLAGYYFEQKKQMKRAFDFYKMAYEKNRSDLYNVYAYARSLDMLGKHQMATQLYKKLLLLTKEGSDIYKQIKSRVYNRRRR